MKIREEIEKIIDQQIKSIYTYSGDGLIRIHPDGLKLMKTGILKAIGQWAVETIGKPIPKDFGWGYVYINGNKYILEEGTKEFRMLNDLIEEQRQRMKKSLGREEDWEKELLLNFFAYSHTPKGNVVLHSETDRERFERLKAFIRTKLKVSQKRGKQ